MYNIFQKANILIIMKWLNWLGSVMKNVMTIDELIALLEKRPVKAESNNEDKTELKGNK